MPTQKQVKDRGRYLSKTEEQFTRKVGVLQTKLHRELIDWLSTRLKVDKEGNLIYNAANTSLLARISPRIDRFMKREGKTLFEWMLRRLRQLFQMNKSYFSDFDSFSEGKFEGVINRVMLNLGYDVKKGTVLTGGWFAQLFSSGSIANQVARNVTAAISSPSTTIGSFAKQFAADFLGVGYLKQHFQTFARDIFFQVDRTQQQQTAEKLKPYLR